MHLKLFDPPHDEKEDRVDDEAKHDDRLEQITVVVLVRQLVEKFSVLQDFAVKLNLLPARHLWVYDSLILRN